MKRLLVALRGWVKLAAVAAAWWMPTVGLATAAQAGHGGGASAAELAGEAPLLPGLGRLNHRVTTHVPLAQRYFDQGLRLIYAFNHDEARRSFQAAEAADPNCAMAAWGIALALGPNYNLEVDAERQQAAYEAIQRAKRLASGVTPHEQRYIEALAERFSDDPAAERPTLDRNYAAAMRKVAASYPHDLDAATLFAAAAMDLRPWDLWQRNGQPQPGTEEIVATLERVLAADPNHPGANHYYIHAVEASPHPERAVAAADRLAALMPAAGHMVHMPSHIYFRIGRYLDAAESNAKAIRVDEAYLERTGSQGVYRALYYPHNVHFLWSAMCMEGRSAEALAAAEQFSKLVPEEMIREMPMIEGFAPTKLFTLVRFGKWEQVQAEPKPAADLTYSVGIWHYGQGVACAALKRFDEAQGHAAELDKIRSATPDDKKLMRHPAKTLLGVAAKLLAGRIRLEQDEPAAGIAALEEAVRLQDTLEYDEPPAWYYPARQSLGAALLTAGRAAEAEKIYREDLQQYPDNGWSLFGLSASLRAQGRVAEAEQATTRFQQAWQRADIALPASQF